MGWIRLPIPFHPSREWLFASALNNTRSNDDNWYVSSHVINHHFPHSLGEYVSVLPPIFSCPVLVSTIILQVAIYSFQLTIYPMIRWPMEFIFSFQKLKREKKKQEDGIVHLSKPNSFIFWATSFSWKASLESKARFISCSISNAGANLGVLSEMIKFSLAIQSPKRNGFSIILPCLCPLT